MRDDRFIETLDGLRGAFDAGRLSLIASISYGPNDADRLRQLDALSRHASVPLAASNDVLYHCPQRRPLQDVLTCIRHSPSRRPISDPKGPA